MRKKGQVVGYHSQGTSRHIVGYRPVSSHDRLAELVGAACDFLFIRKGMKLDPRSFYFGNTPVHDRIS